MPILQYIGKRPKLIYDPPWLLGGPYIFDKEIDDAKVEVDPVDAADMVGHSPGCFAVVEGVEPPEASESGGAPAGAGASNNDAPAQFNCVLCEGVFKSKSGLAAHMKAKHGDNEE